MEKVRKYIRIFVLSILYIFVAGDLIYSCITLEKIRNIVFIMSLILLVLLDVLLLMQTKCQKKVGIFLDITNVILFILMMITFPFSTEVDQFVKVSKEFQGNNGFVSAYSDGIGDGYQSREKAVNNAIEGQIDYKELKELYRVQCENNLYVYFVTSEEVHEFKFRIQDNGYKYLGSTGLDYSGFSSSHEYGIEDTIRADIANTLIMGSGTDNNELTGPVFGVTNIETIDTVRINSRKVDYVKKINEIDGNSYYFWLIKDIGEINEIEEIKTISIKGV